MTSTHANQTVPEVVDHAGIRAEHYQVQAPAGTVMLAPAAVAPTQVRRPWRSTIRTVWQAFLGLCVLAPILVQGAGLDPKKLPWLATVLLVAAAVTRVMAIPAVEAWLRRFVPFLAAAPAPRELRGR